MSQTANIEITASSSRLPAALRQAKKILEGFAVTAGRPFMEIGRSLGTVASFGMAARGLDMLVDQGKDIFAFNKELTRFGIDIRKTPADMEGIGQAIRKLSNETGVGAMEILKAGRAYVDLAGAGAFTQERMELIARAAQASGADVKDMAGLLFTLTENMKVPPGELENTIGGLINQAKDGSIHFRELANELVALGPVFRQYGVSGREGSIQLGAMMQIARRGFGSASEAATGVLRILRSIPQHASKFRKFGVDVFKKGSKTDLEAFLTVFDRIRKSKLRLDREQLIKAFGRTEGERFFQLLKDMTGQFDQLIAAGRENGTVAKDLGTFTTSSAGRMDIAFQKMKNTLAEAFTPERIEKFVQALERATELVGPIANAVGKIGDVLGGLYGAGKAIRGFFSPDESKLAAPTIEEIQLEAKRSGVDDASALQKLQGDRAARLRTIQQFKAAMKNDEATLESDKLAVAARFTPTDVPGFEGIRSAGARYLEASGMGIERRDELFKQILADRADADIKAGQGSSANADMVAAFEQAIKTTLAPEVSRAVAAAVDKRPNVLQVDGNPIAKSSANATNQRRRP